MSKKKVSMQLIALAGLFAMTALGRAQPIALKEKITLGGVPQTILIRGENAANPVLLFLHGGPGYSEMPYIALFQTPLEKHFTVVHWDQRGTGQSYSPDIPRESMTLDRMVEDLRELTQHLLRRFGQRKIYLIGHSWGTVLGTLAAQRYPELYHAYIGMGQVTNVAESERISYDFTLRQAQKAGDARALQELGAIGEPPLYGQRLENVNIQRKWLQVFGGSTFEPSADQRCSSAYLSSPESRGMDDRRLQESIRFSMESLANEVVAVDLFKQAPRLEVPVYFLVGKRDYTTSFELVERYYRTLIAPQKELIWFEHSGHHPHFEEPERFAQTLIRIARTHGN